MIERAELYRRLAPELGLEMVDPLAPGCASVLAKRLLIEVNS
jgi:hypothetical protein